MVFSLSNPQSLLFSSPWPPPLLHFSPTPTQPPLSFLLSPPLPISTPSNPSPLSSPSPLNSPSPLTSTPHSPPTPSLLTSSSPSPSVVAPSPPPPSSSSPPTTTPTPAASCSSLSSITRSKFINRSIQNGSFKHPYHWILRMSVVPASDEDMVLKAGVAIEGVLITRTLYSVSWFRVETREERVVLMPTTKQGFQSVEVGVHIVQRKALCCWRGGGVLA